MIKRRDYKIVGLTVSFLLCCIGYCPLTVSSAEVWSDDFNDGNYDGWTICNNTAFNPPSNWSAVNNYLQIEQDDHGTIYRTSSVAYGTWSFDFKANETQVESGTAASVSFIGQKDINNVTQVAVIEDACGYWLRFRIVSVTEGHSIELSLRKWIDGLDHVIDSSATKMSVGDWHNIAVTRNTTGGFSVYQDRLLTMQGIDTEMTTCDRFTFSTNSWHMFDNVVVYDEPLIITPTTTTSTETLDWLLIGTGITAVVLVVVLVIILKRR